MSWYTDAPEPCPAGLQRTAALLLRVGPADHDGAARPWVPACLPDRGAKRTPGSRDVAGATPRVLAFGEDELARVAAAIAMAAARDARAACADEAAAGQALALERMAAAVTDAVQTRHADETRCLRQLIDLAQALARALTVDADGSRAAAIVDMVRAMLATLPRQSAVRVVVASEHAPMLQAALPEIASRLGCDGAIEVAGDARLPPGAVQLVWPGGWLEHAPAQIQHRLAGLLTACRPADSSTTPGMAPAGAPAMIDGDEHGLD